MGRSSWQSGRSFCLAGGGTSGYRERYRWEEHDGNQAGRDQGCSGRGLDHLERQSDLSRRDDERQRGCLEQSRGQGLRTAEGACVEHRGKPAHGEQGGDEERDLDQTGRARERSEVELETAGDEEDRNEEAVAQRLKLGLELGVRRHLVAV